MSINFAAANTAGLNNPGTEIITLVKDGSGNFINPPSYDKMRAYLRSGEVPMLFVIDEARTTGDIYQLSGYSETTDIIRFACRSSVIEFHAGDDFPIIYDTSIPLTGSTSELHPTEVEEAVLAGRPVVLRHTDSLYGILKFTNFNIADDAAVIASNTIIEVGDVWVVYGMFGNLESQKWIGKYTTLPNS